jgi:hypothetical protein
LLTALALRAYFAVLQLAEPGLNPRLKLRDLGLELGDDSGRARCFQLAQTIPLVLLLLQRLGETDAPSVKE